MLGKSLADKDFDVVNRHVGLKISTIGVKKNLQTGIDEDFDIQVTV